VAVRRSSDLLAVEDRHVVTSLRLIRRQATEGLTAADVHERSELSRRALEQRFRRSIGRSIGKEIIRVRFAEARDLLARTTVPIATIASRCGFSSPQRFATAFTKAFGQSPASFRASEEPD
jgi:LacI family transcriptional regulator